VLLKAQSLRSHSLYLFVKCVHLLFKPRVFRSRRIVVAQLFEDFLNGEFGRFRHGNPILPEGAASALGEAVLSSANNEIKNLRGALLYEGEPVGQRRCLFHDFGWHKTANSVTSATCDSGSAAFKHRGIQSENGRQLELAQPPPAPAVAQYGY